MPFEDSLIGNDDFDPRAATESLIRQVSELPPGGPVDTRALTTRLARKLGQPQPNAAPEASSVPASAERSGALDFSAQAAPPPLNDTSNTGLDFSAEAVPPVPLPQPRPPEAPVAAATSLSDYPIEAGKSFVRGSKDMVAAGLKGVAGAGIPTTADPALLDDLGRAGTMTAGERAKVMGRVLTTVSDRGLQMDYNAALRRIAAGADPATEVAALQPRFAANNATAAQPVTEKPLYQAGHAVEDFGKSVLTNKPGFEPGKSWTSDIASGAGSMVTGMALSMIPGVGPAAAGTLFTTAGMGEAVDNAVKGGATPEQTRQATLLGGVAGATDMVDTILPMLGSTGKALGFIKRMGTAAVKGAMLEGGQEGVQQLMQNAIAKGIYKPDQDMFEDVARSVAIAAILGGVAGGASGAAHGDHTPAPPNVGTAGPQTGPAGPGVGTSGPQPGPHPAGGEQSSPEDIADFVKKANAGSRERPENTSQAPPGPDFSTMSEADRQSAFTAAREAFDGAKMDDILRAYGWEESTIGQMGEQDKIDEVSTATGNAEADAQAKPEAQPEQPTAEAQPEPASHLEYAVLREYGYGDDDITNMSPKQRQREVQDAYASGVKPGAAMQKHKAPPRATSESDVGAGTREEPIKATAAEDVLKAQPVEPTPAQATAENYKHAHVDLEQLGLTGKNNISIETGVGQQRKGTSPDGKDWSVTMEHAAYGRIKGTRGADGQPLDIFVGPHPKSPHVFVVDQQHQGGGFDEHKVLAGFLTPIDALHAYANSYADMAKGRIGGVTAMTADDFKQWIKSGDHTKPLKTAGVKPAPSEPVKAEGAGPSTEAAAAAGVPKETPTSDLAKVVGSDAIIQNQPKSSVRPPTQRKNNSEQPTSLLQFIASHGGLAPHPELDALDVGDHRVQIPGRKGFFGVVRPTGMSLDMMREAAEEAGYLKGEHNKTSTVRDLLDLIDNEMRGQQRHAQGEEGAKTKRQRQSEAESSAAARDKAVAAAHDDIAAEYSDLPPDLHAKAAEIMADERLDVDSAVEMAAVRMVNEDADYEVTPNDFTDTFGEGATDAIRPKATSEDGGAATPARGQEQRPGEGEEAGEHGERVPDAGAQGTEEQGEVTLDENGTPIAIGDRVSATSIGGHEFEATITRFVKNYPDGAPAAELQSDPEPVAGKKKERPGGLSIHRLDRIMKVAATEPTAAGEQTVLPGAEKIGDGELAQRKADTGLKPSKPQKPTDIGLFSDERDQGDLLDTMARKVPVATTMLDDLIQDQGYKLIHDDNGLRTYQHNDDAGRENVRAVGQMLRGLGWKADGLRSFKNPATGEVAEIEPGGEDTSGHYLHIGKEITTGRLTDLDGKSAEVQAADSDETVTVTLSRQGPWDFNDTWPAPDVERLRAMEKEGRNPLADGYDVENVVGMLDEGMNGITSAIAEIRAIDGAMADIRSGATKLRRNQTVEDALTPLQRDRGRYAAEVRDTAAAYEDVFGKEAAQGMIKESRKRLVSEEHGSPGQRQRAPTDAIEAALGEDADKVAPVDIARASEIMAENESMDPATAFGQAVIENAVDQGFITEPEAIEAYGEEVKDVLDAGREGASGSGAHLEQGGSASEQERPGGAAQTGVVPGGGEAGEGVQARETGRRAGDDTAAAAGTAEQSAANGQEGANRAAAEGANDTTGLVEGQKEPHIEAGASDGISPRLHERDAGSEPEAVPEAEGLGRAGPLRGNEGAGSGADVSGVDEGRPEGERLSEAAVREGGRGASESGPVRVSGRHGDEQTGRSEGVDGREARAVKGENYHIAPGSLAEDRSQRTKATDNIQAIKLSNRIVDEGRPATVAEQHQLARYVGWGGIKNAFPDVDGNYGKGFEQIGADVREVLTPEEYDTARRSIQYAHYTAEDIITSMWGIAQRLGFTGGSVFEPGMGVGHFAGLMPADLAEHSAYHGVELDHVSARIAHLLYPKWGVRREDFTRMALAENAFDLAIGNPPFASISVQADPKYKQGFLLHDYFFAKSLDAVRPGGVLMFVTSAGTMNKIDPSARKYLADRADLVGAVRLPSNAFKKNAGTEVTTDIVILRKRLPGEATGDRTWTETAEVTLPGPDGKPMKGQISRYFAEHPEMVLGKGDFADKLYEGRYSVKAWDNFDLKDALAVATGKLPRNVMSEAETPQHKAEADFEGTEKKDGSYYVKDGRLMQQRGGAGYEVERRGKGVEGGKTAAELDRIRGLVPIRDALRQTFAADLADDADAGKMARAKLNKAYDAFVEKFGPINKAEIQRRRPNTIQQEAARAEAREEARYAGAEFDEGSFDAARLADAGKSLTEIARARKAAREEQGDKYREGSFDPEDMPDTIIDKRPNIEPFAEDQENYRLRAIENYDEPTGKGFKGAVFSRNIITKDRSPEIKSINDAALYVLNQKGSLDIDAVGTLVGKSHSETIEAMGDRIYQVPGTKDAWETREKYLSGNVRKKLAIAKAEAARNPIFRRNVEALEAAQPAPLAPSQIGASLGMPWIPVDTVEQFGKEALGLSAMKVRYSPVIASWAVSGDTDSVAATSTWGTPRRNATALLLDALNRQTPKIYDEGPEKGQRTLNIVATQAAQDKMQAIRDKFNEWIFSDEKRADRLASFYNQNYNNLVVQDFDGSYLTTPGISSEWTWRPHQKRVVARIIQDGNTYVAQAVGAGKTSDYIAAAMEMRRLGLVHKPMHVVPNHMLAQFTKEFYELYPTARIMVADERNFHTDRRKQFMANVALEDLDSVIITHSAFGMIPVSDEFQDSIIEKELDEYRHALADTPKDGDNRITRSRIEKQIERLEQRLSGKSNRRRDNVFNFDEMGVDFLFVDEAQEFRKLDFNTQMSNLKGITPQGSGKAWDLYVKSRLLDERNPGRSLVLGSGTPVTNTMAELYTVSRYLQRRELQERQLLQFDAWAGAFGENVSELEQDAAGGYKTVSRFAKFVNVAELSAMVRQVMDVVTSRQLEQYVTRPKLKGGNTTMNMADKSPALERYQAHLAARMKAMEGRGRPKPGDDIMLKVIGDGRHAAIDMRLVGGEQDADFPSKLDLLVDNAFNIWKRTKQQKFYRPGNGGYDMSNPVDIGPATQMIFANLGISGTRGFSVPDYIRAELVRRGVPRDQIAFIADYKSHVAKQKLFNDMNEAKVRFMIGSTQKMGTGVNAQRRLYATHNLDPLWYPADDEQRNGRALRQGNWNPEIERHAYSTKGTYDSSMWGLMEKKARFIQGFFEGDPSLRVMDDLGEASQYEQAKALTTNDPRLMRLTDLRQQYERANRRKAAFDNEAYAMRRRRAEAISNIEYYEARAGALEKDIAQRVPLAGDAFKAKIGKETFDKRVDFGEALLATMDKVATPQNNGRHVPIGEISGFSLVAHVQKIADHMSVTLDMKRNGGAESHVTVGTSGLGAVRSMESIIGGFDHDLAHTIQKIEGERKYLADSESKKDNKFAGGAEIESLGEQIRGLQAELSKKDEPKPPPQEAEGEDVLAALSPAAAEKMPEIENLVRSIVRHLVGNNVKLELSDGLMPVPRSASAAWGDMANAGARGLYFPWRRLVRLAMIEGVDSAAFHEAYHAIEYQLQTPQERELMQRETPRLRDYIERTRKAYTRAQIDALDGEEVRAIAFEDYATARSKGDAEAGRGAHIGVRRWFDRLWQALKRLANGLRGLGFKTYEDIFDKAYRGEYAKAEGATPRPEVGPEGEALASINPAGGGRRGPPPASETIAQHLEDRNFNRLAKLSRALGLGRINTTELRVQLQDKFIRVRDTERLIDPALDSSQSAYQAESLYYGRTGEQLEKLEQDHFDPLVTDMKARDISLEGINEYLYAKHAPERNRRMDEINHPELDPGSRDLRGRGSGMSDEEAQAILDRITAEGKIADYEAIERRIRTIIDNTREGLVESGLLSQEAADAWAGQYEFYVPLRGFEEGTEDETMSGRGAGFDTRARETQQAFGRLSKAAGPLPYIMQQAEMAIVRGEKNRVGNAWLRFVRSHPEPDRWTVDTPPTKKAIDKRTGLVTTVQDAFWHLKPDIFVTKIGGKPVLIQMKGKDGENVVRALKNMGASNLNSVLRFMHALTSTMSRLATQWNPNFTVPNFARDVGEAFINLQAQDQANFVKRFSKHLFPAIKGSFNALRGASGGVYGDAFREFDKAGGRIRFFGLENHEDVEKNINQRLRRLEGGAINNIRAAGEAAAHGFEIVNGAIENATRLAAFMAARDVGMSARDAAMLARNLTVDFNKKGELGSAINALYMFANASIQGTVRTASAMTNKRVRRAAYLLAVAGALGALANILGGGDDDDGETYYSKIKPYIRDKNLIIMYPKGFGHDGQYVKIPLPYGFSPFHVLGDRLAGVTLGKDKPGSAMWAVLASIADAFNPLGEESASMFSILPSVFRPAAHIQANVNWNGNPIYPKRDFEKNKPNSEQSFKSNSAFAKEAARDINKATGGSPYKSGWADWHAGSIDHVFESLTGGLGKFVKDVIFTGTAIYKGDPFDATKAPILRRFVGSVTDPQVTEASYYEAREQALKNGGDALKNARKDRARGINVEDAESFLTTNTNSPRGEQIFKSADKAMKPLRDRKERVEANTTLSATDKRSQLADITEQMRRIQIGARKQYLELQRGAGAP